jgi:tetratricopeptide (TPR) repeat protein
MFRRFTLMRLFYGLFLVLLSTQLLMAQREPGGKPVLIRPEPVEVKDKDEPVEPDPKLSAEHLTIGDFYLRRNNLRAAEERYREAVRYNPKSIEAYEKLVKTLERAKEFQQAALVCEEFLEFNPDSERAEHFRKQADKLRRKR